MREHCPSGWARARLGDRETGVTELRQALAAYTDQGNKVWCRSSKVCSPSSKPKGKARTEALTRIDEALALAGETGEHWTDAFLHRIRGEILLKRDPANTAPAEEAFLHRHRHRAAAKGAEFRAARGDQARTALARPGQTAASSRTARSGLWLVYEGFDTLDLKEAKALLDELRA